MMKVVKEIGKSVASIAVSYVAVSVGFAIGDAICEGAKAGSKAVYRGIKSACEPKENKLARKESELADIKDEIVDIELEIKEFDNKESVYVIALDKQLAGLNVRRVLLEDEIRELKKKLVDRETREKDNCEKVEASEGSNDAANEDNEEVTVSNEELETVASAE